MLPVGVNPNTQIMGSNCEGSERSGATLSRSRTVTQREGGEVSEFSSPLWRSRLVGVDEKDGPTDEHTRVYTRRVNGGGAAAEQQRGTEAHV